MLRLKPFEEFFPERPGEQIHINHEDCSAGEDTRERLYLRKTDDGNAILGYCHNCGESGSYRLDAAKRAEKRRSIGDVGTRDSVHTAGTTAPFGLPKDFTGDIKEFPAKARAWLYSYYLTDEDIKRYGIGYSDRLRRLVLPIYLDGDLGGFQTRRIFDDDTATKYKTYFAKSGKCVFRSVSVLDSDNIILTEDILSAIRVGKINHAAALLGTNLSDKDANELAGKYNRIVIWLDNDNMQVKKNQRKIKNKLSLLCKDVRIIDKYNKDPKEFNDKELNSILKESTV